jgi:hypothetical protein
MRMCRFCGGTGEPNMYVNINGVKVLCGWCKGIGLVPASPGPSFSPSPSPNPSPSPSPNRYRPREYIM